MVERRGEAEHAPRDGRIDNLDLALVHRPLLVADLLPRDRLKDGVEHVVLGDEPLAALAPQRHVPHLGALLLDGVHPAHAVASHRCSRRARRRLRDGEREDARPRVDRLGAKDGRPHAAGPADGALERPGGERRAPALRHDAEREDARLGRRREVGRRADEGEVAHELALGKRERHRLEPVGAGEGERDRVPEPDRARVGYGDEARLALGRLRRRGDERGEREGRVGRDAGREGRLRREGEDVGRRRAGALRDVGESATVPPSGRKKSEKGRTLAQFHTKQRSELTRRAKPVIGSRTALTGSVYGSVAARGARSQLGAAARRRERRTHRWRRWPPGPRRASPCARQWRSSRP